MVGAMPVTIWDCHDTFWKNRRFVTWQLLRRNSKYKIIFGHALRDDKTQLVSVLKRSYPPADALEKWESWKTRLKVFESFLKHSPTLDGFGKWLAGEKGFENWPDKSGFGTWLDRKEAGLEVPYEDFSIRELISELHIPVVNTVIMDIQTRQVSERKFIVNPEVDFPPLHLLPRRFQSPPSENDKKAYGAYLYDRKFEPFHVGRGRPKEAIREALRAWDLSQSGKRDAEIARMLSTLTYPWPDKSPELQRVHDLRESADKAIKAVYP
jgi:hypothetical protein